MQKQTEKILWNKGKKTVLVPSSAYKKQDIRVTGRNAWKWKGGKPNCEVCGIGVSYGNKFCRKHCNRKINIKSLIPHSEIIERYLKKEPSTKIAKIAGISPSAVFGILIRNNVPRRTKAESEKIKRKYNHEAIANDYKDGMFLCAVAEKYGTDSSNILHILKKNGVKSRGFEGRRKGVNHPMWKGGKTHDHSGYVIQKEGRTHRILMEETIGRKLCHWESVHHIDGDKKNCRIDNLVVMSGREHIRFHTFLRMMSLGITKENLAKFCRKESDFVYHFSIKDFREVCFKIGIKPKSLNKNKRKVCRVDGCEGMNAGYGFCSKHYQRYIAKKRGYWKSGRGRITSYLGKFTRTNNKIKNRP
jgi:hypothetical protein